MKDFTILVVHYDFSEVGPDEDFFGGRGPADDGDLMGVLFAPLAIALDASHDDVAVFVGDADLGAIGAPSHIADEAGFAVVDHFFDPLPVVFHEDDDGAGGIAGGQFAVLFIPDDEGDVALVVGEICAFVAGGAP